MIINRTNTAALTFTSFRSVPWSDLPDGYQYMEYPTEDENALRTNVQDFKEFKKWLESYESKSDTCWINLSEYTFGCKNRHRKTYCCHHGPKRLQYKSKKDLK